MGTDEEADVKAGVKRAARRDRYDCQCTLRMWDWRGYVPDGQRVREDCSVGPRPWHGVKCGGSTKACAAGYATRSPDGGGIIEPVPPFSSGERNGESNADA